MSPHIATSRIPFRTPEVPQVTQHVSPGSLGSDVGETETQKLPKPLQSDNPVLGVDLKNRTSVFCRQLLQTEIGVLKIFEA